jgi:peroxiredoxin
MSVLKKIHTVSSVVLSLALICLAETGSVMKRAPDFSLENLNGSKFTLSENLKSGPCIINFWATWCSPCLAEMKELAKIQKEYAKSNVKVISISIDDPKSISSVRSTVNTRKFPFIILLDPAMQVYKALFVKNVPHIFIIDSDGMIRYDHQGYKKGDELKLKVALDQILKK